MKRVRKLPGMTLIEILLAIAILAIMMAICASILGFLMSTNRIQNQIIEDEMNVRKAMLSIAQEIHLIEPSYKDASGNIQAFDDDGDVVGFTTVNSAGPNGNQYQIRVGGANDRLTLFKDGNDAASDAVHDYMLMGGNLVDAANGNRIVAEGIREFRVFTNVEPDVSKGASPTAKAYIKDIKLTIAGAQTHNTGYSVRLEDVSIRVLRGTY